jgi:hypothetical protein
MITLRRNSNFTHSFQIYLYPNINRKEATKEFVFPKVKRLLRISLRKKLLISGTLFFKYDSLKRDLNFTHSLKIYLHIKVDHRLLVNTGLIVSLARSQKTS